MNKVNQQALKVFNLLVNYVETTGEENADGYMQAGRYVMFSQVIDGQDTLSVCDKFSADAWSVRAVIENDQIVELEFFGNDEERFIGLVDEE